MIYCIYTDLRKYKVVGLARLELATSPLSGVRSNQAELQAHIFVPKINFNLYFIYNQIKNFIVFLTNIHCLYDALMSIFAKGTNSLIKYFLFKNSIFLLKLKINHRFC